MFRHIDCWVVSSTPSLGQNRYRPSITEQRQLPPTTYDEFQMWRGSQYTYKRPQFFCCCMCTSESGFPVFSGSIRWGFQKCVSILGKIHLLESMYIIKNWRVPYFHSVSTLWCHIMNMAANVNKAISIISLMR